MTDAAPTRTVTLPTALVERLEALAQREGQPLDAMLQSMLDAHENVPPTAPSVHNWALAVARDMEAADIEWKGNPDLSEHSRENYRKAVTEHHRRLQQRDDPDNG